MHPRKVGGYLGSNNTTLCVEWKKELGLQFGEKWFFQVSIGLLDTNPWNYWRQEEKKSPNDRKVDNLAIVFGAMAQWAVQPSLLHYSIKVVKPFEEWL
jgi:hypothetical protein